jgi:endo-1,4-beta-D-glucanase Y
VLKESQLMAQHRHHRRSASSAASRWVAASAALATTAALGVVTALGGAAHAADAPARPFPQHVTYKTGVMPSPSAAVRDAAVKKQYDSWKATYLVAGCATGQYYVSTKGDDDAPNDGPVSESQGYGMNIVPLMAGYDANAKAEFDGLWSLVKTHRDGQGMMQWQLDGKTCKYADNGTPDGATDGDLDIGYGLVLADTQWGGYTADAKDWLAKFYAADVAPDGHLKVEDDGDNTDTRPSDHMIDHLRAFAAYDTAHDWNKVVTRTEAVISEFTAAYSPTAGLLSDFVVGANTTSPKPAPARYQENQPDNIVGYNSIRVPWHMGTDALLNGSGAAVSLATAKKESACLKAQSGGDPAKVYPHTNLDCSPRTTDGAGHEDTVAEEAGDPVGPSAMAAGDQVWTDAIWNYLATNPYGDKYYGETIKMLVYIVMSGNYWSPAGSDGGPGDTTAPSVPGNVHTTSVSSSAVGLAWDASTDDTAVTGYDVYRNGAALASVAGTTYTDTSVIGSTTYAYTVRAHDAVPNNSAFGTTLAVTTPAGGGGGTASYEAEKGSLSGSAKVAGCNKCSGAKKVTGLGNGGTLTFPQVSAGATGPATLTISYVGSSTARTAQITVDGVAKTVNFPSVARNALGTVTLSVQLTAGTGNTVIIANPSAAAPDIDRIVI